MTLTEGPTPTTLTPDPGDRRAFAAKVYRYDWTHDKLVLPCGCDYPSCPGWRSEYESSVNETQYPAAVLADALAFRGRFLADRDVTGEVPA